MEKTRLALNLFNMLLSEARRHQEVSASFITLLAIDSVDLQPGSVNDPLIADYAVFNAFAKPQVFAVRDAQLVNEVKPVNGKASAFPFRERFDEVIKEVAVPHGTEHLNEYKPEEPSPVDWSILCDDAQLRLGDIAEPLQSVVSDRSDPYVAEILVLWLNQHNIRWTTVIKHACLDIHNGKPQMAMNPEWVDSIKEDTLVYSIASVLCSHKNYLMKKLDW